MAVLELTHVDERTKLDLMSLLRSGPVFAFVVGLIGFARVGAGGALRMMWSDDAKYLANVQANGPLESLTHLHHGYLNLAATSIATMLEPVPLEAAVVAYAAAWAVGVGLIAWFVADRSRGLFETEWAPLVLGAAVALMPIAGYESVGNISYLQWYLLIGATFALVCDAPERDRAGAMVVLLCGLSAPAAVMLAPFVWWRRDRRLVAAAWFVGVGVQAVAILSAWGDRVSGDDWFAFNRSLSTFAASSVNGLVSPVVESGVLLPLSLGLVAVVTAAVAGDAHRFGRVAVLFAAAGLQWWFTFSSNGSPWPDSSRYALVPTIAALAVVLVAIERRTTLVVSVMAVLALCWVGGFSTSDLQELGPGWVHQLETECVGGVVQVDVAPMENRETVAVQC